MGSLEEAEKKILSYEENSGLKLTEGAKEFIRLYRGPEKRNQISGGSS